ncbi:MAG TPA: SMI1/KNR4 family protein [Anaerolineae bacterium]|nr:SMI1/KNR4 family protein [Anaerolineae bacterium]
MIERIKQLTNGFFFHTGASLDSIAEIQANLHVTFPNDYVDFLSYSDGADGYIGNAYLKLFNLDRIARLRQQTLASGVKSELILFGSDGATWSYAFDSRLSPAPIVGVDPIVLEDTPPERYAETFIGFLEYLESQRK